MIILILYKLYTYVLHTCVNPPWSIPVVALNAMLPVARASVRVSPIAMPIGDMNAKMQT